VMGSSNAGALEPRWWDARALMHSSPSTAVVDPKAFSKLRKFHFKPNFHGILASII